MKKKRFSLRSWFVSDVNETVAITLIAVTISIILSAFEIGGVDATLRGNSSYGNLPIHLVPGLGSSASVSGSVSRAPAPTHRLVPQKAARSSSRSVEHRAAPKVQYRF